MMDYNNFKYATFIFFADANSYQACANIIVHPLLKACVRVLLRAPVGAAPRWVPQAESVVQ